MLGHYWRLRASNTQNQNITVTVKARLFKYGSDGSLSWSSEQTLINAASVSATTGTTVSSNIDNSTDKYLGMELTASFAASSATNSSGVVSLTLERSTDSGTTWPSQDKGIVLGAHNVPAADGTTTIRRNFQLR